MIALSVLLGTFLAGFVAGFVVGSAMSARRRRAAAQYRPYVNS
jgi:hypothetical protein